MWSSVRVAFAASLWVVAVLLMVVATVDGYKVVFAGWSILAAMAGCVFIVWQLLAIGADARGDHRAAPRATAASERGPGPAPSLSLAVS
jgi:hypothetical protein